MAHQAVLHGRGTEDHVGIVHQDDIPQILLPDGQDDTLNTPEILNSIVNMHSGPFTNYRRQDQNSNNNTTNTLLNTSNSSSFQQLPHFSTFEYSTRPLDQQYKPPFPGEDDRLLGMRTNQSELSADESQSSFLSPGISSIKIEDIPQEDLIRRMRRRERNKVAATKCRNKKKMKSQLLVKESEELEFRNQHLKIEIQKLEKEKRHLIHVLSSTDPSFAKRLKEMAPKIDEQYFDVSQHFSRIPRPEPPSFADAMRLVRGDQGGGQQGSHFVKLEEEEEDEEQPYLRPQIMYYDNVNNY